MTSPVTRWQFREDLAAGLNPYFASLSAEHRAVFVEYHNAIDHDGNSRLGPEHWMRLVDPYTGQFVAPTEPSILGRLLLAITAALVTAVVGFVALVALAPSNSHTPDPQVAPPAPAPSTYVPNPIPTELRATTPTAGPGWKRFDKNPRYNPCAPIYWRYNPAGAPADRLTSVEEAVRTIATATGLNFVYDGTTSDIPAVDDPKGYDLTIGWTDPAHVPDLSGSRTLALGGSVYYERADGISEDVHGYIAINIDRVDRSKGQKLVLVLEHELGHVVGLAHSDDPKALMYPELGPSQHGLTASDLAGLRAVGSQAGCIQGSLRAPHPAA